VRGAQGYGRVMVRVTRWATVLAVVVLAGCGAGAGPVSSPTGGSGSAVPPVSPTATATVGPTESATASEVACSPFGATGDVDSADPLALSPLTGASMRVGRHDCFERFVFQMAGTGEVPGWSVGYQDPMTADGSGEPVDLRGAADLVVTVGVWTVSDFEGRPEEWPPFEGPDDIVTTGFVSLREARNLYAFEGVTQIGLGLDRKRPFRVTWMEAPARLVVDVYTGTPLS
jgi:hypothetical protein